MAVLEVLEKVGSLSLPFSQALLNSVVGVDFLTFFDGFGFEDWGRETTEEGFLEELVDFRVGEAEGVCLELHPSDSYSDKLRMWAPEVQEVELDISKEENLLIRKW